MSKQIISIFLITFLIGSSKPKGLLMETASTTATFKLYLK